MPSFNFRPYNPMGDVFWLGGLLVVLVILALALVRRPSRGGRRSGFLIYPYLDLWDARDVGGRGLYYPLMDCPGA